MLSGAPGFLHQIRRHFRHLAALALEQIHVRHEGLPLQAIARVNEAVGVRIDIRIIDLPEVNDGSAGDAGKHRIQW